jgi:hypothetical protein
LAKLGKKVHFAKSEKPAPKDFVDFEISFEDFESRPTQSDG